jgi:hypothetical protein
MFCEEYGHRASGVPDLMWVPLSFFPDFLLTGLASVWNVDEKKCRFVEVKSPNDHLSETQKVWISVMQSAGVDVEVCHVADAPVNASVTQKRRRLNNGGWGKKKEYDYGDESDMQECDEDEDEDVKDKDQWQFEEGNEARSNWKGEGRLLSKAQFVDETGSGEEGPPDDKENFRRARERSRSVAPNKRKARPQGRQTSVLRKTASVEIRGDVSEPIEL